MKKILMLLFCSLSCFATLCPMKSLYAENHPSKKIYIARFADFSAEQAQDIATQLSTKLSLPVELLPVPWLETDIILSEGWKEYLRNQARSLRPDKRNEILSAVQVTEEQISDDDLEALEKIFQYIMRLDGGNVDDYRNQLKTSIDSRIAVPFVQKHFADLMKQDDFGALIVLTNSYIYRTEQGWGGWKNKIAWGEMYKKISLVSPGWQKESGLFDSTPSLPALVNASLASLGWSLNTGACDNRYSHPTSGRDSWQKEYQLLMSEPKQPTAACMDALNRALNPGGGIDFVREQSGRDLTWDTTDEEIQTTAPQLLMDERFDELEQKANKFRENKSRSISGDWWLGDFYNNVAKIENIPELLEKLERWKTAYPDSVNQRFVLAYAYYEIAWKERGTSLAVDVPKSAWPKFVDNLQKARDILDKMEEAGVKEPVLYSLLVKVLNGLNAPKEDIQTAFERGIALEPLYGPLYQDRAHYLQPKWGGAEGAIERFADESVAKTKNLAGDSLYFVIAKAFIEFDPYSYAENQYLPWDKVRRGYADFQKTFPNSLNNLHVFGRLACLAMDQAVARDVFKKTGDQWDDRMKNFWGYEQHFQEWIKWANNQSPYPGAEELVMAISNGDLDKVKKLLDEGRDINAHTNDGSSPLIFAIQNSKNEIAKYLIERGADVKAQSYYSHSTALSSAINGNHEDMITLLLQHGASVNEKDDDGIRPLYSAVKSEHLSMVKFLLAQEGIDINAAENTGGWTPLHVAVYHRKTDIVQMLVEAGADVNKKTSNSWSPLLTAAYNNDASIVSILLKGKGVDPNIRTDKDWTALHYASLEGNDEMVKMLLDHGADPNARTVENYSPLGEAKYGKHPSTEQIIIERGGT